MKNIDNLKVGGIALFNGLILKSKLRESISQVYDGNIEIETNDRNGSIKKFSIFEFPIVRGIVNIVDTFKNSVSYVIASAKQVINSLVDVNEEELKIGKFEIISSYIISITLIVSVLILLPNILSLLFAENIRNIIQLMFQILIFVFYLITLKNTKMLNVLFEYHGAEHKVVNAYEKFGIDNLDIKNVRDSSRFHVRCGGNLIVYFFVINIIFTLFMPSENIIFKSILQVITLALSLGVSYELVMLLSKIPNKLSFVNYPAMSIQFITTKEPSNDKIKLAIYGMLACINKDVKVTIEDYINRFLEIKEYDLKIIIKMVASIKNEEYENIFSNIKDVYLNLNEMIKLDEMIDKYYVKKLPIQYVTNSQNFFREKYFVNESVLIPRSDTEILVEKSIEYIEKYNLNSMIDMCTGSGCVGISIAKNSSVEKVLLVDVSNSALKVANKNIEINNAFDKCKILKSDLFSEIKNNETKFDIIVSNPPYIPTKDIETLSDEVKKEPHIALDGGMDGMDFYNKILENAKNYLNNNGFIIFEIGYDELDKIKDLISRYPEYELLECIRDYGENDRVIVCRLHQM